MAPSVIWSLVNWSLQYYHLATHTGSAKLQQSTGQVKFNVWLGVRTAVLALHEETHVQVRLSEDKGTSAQRSVEKPFMIALLCISGKQINAAFYNLILGCLLRRFILPKSCTSLLCPTAKAPKYVPIQFTTMVGPSLLDLKHTSCGQDPNSSLSHDQSFPFYLLPISFC